MNFFLIIALIVSCGRNSNGEEKNLGHNTEREQTNIPITPNNSGGGDLEREIILAGQRVEDIFSHPGELTIIRDRVVVNPSELCHTKPIDNFLSGIFYYTQENMSFKKAAIHTIGSYYALSTNQNKLYANSLISHKLCTSSKDSLIKSLGNKNIPDSDTISLLNDFAKTHNGFREKAIKGDKPAKEKLALLWSRFSFCLSFVESLTTADDQASFDLAKKYAPADYSKPLGVKFYYDKWQSPASRLNIGLYQFTPNKTNNIHTCLNDWNQRYPRCKIEDRSSDNLVKLLGGSLQRFNAFCGVNKIVQTFSVQVNTARASSTHESNKLSDGLKSAKDRCVSPHFRAGLAYNHFGPLQNSTGKNLKKLMSCVMSDPF